MTIQLGVVMDPIGSIKAYKDSTLAMLLEAQARGWTIRYMEQGDLFLRDGQAFARQRAFKVFDDTQRWFEWGEENTGALSGLDVIQMLAELKDVQPFATVHAVGTADVLLAAPRNITLAADVAARLEPTPTPHTEALRQLGPLDKPYWHIERARVGSTRQVVVELLFNGLPVEARAVAADGATRHLQFEFTPPRSGWLALRINAAAHTNPIWVTVAGAPIRVKRSAQWCRAAVDVCWEQKVRRIREAERGEEAALYERGRRFYERMLAEAPS